MVGERRCSIVTRVKVTIIIKIIIIRYDNNIIVGPFSVLSLLLSSSSLLCGIGFWESGIGLHHADGNHATRAPYNARVRK